MSLGQNIGKTMTNGFAGSFSRQPDTIIDTHPLGGSAALAFGSAVVLGTGDAVVAVGGSSVAADFVGVALRETKSATNYLSQNVGAYNPGDAVPVIKRGCVNVFVQKGNASYPNAAVGGFEAAADSTNTIKLTNVKFKGAADANGIAEIRILEPLHA